MQRLQTRPQFQAVLGGLLIAKTEHFALHRSALTDTALILATGSHRGNEGLFPGNEVWLGAMTPKRWAKRAVTRNAIKRQIYSVSADFESLYPRAAFVIRLRREFSRRVFVSASSDTLKAAIRDELSALLEAGIKAS